MSKTILPFNWPLDAQGNPKALITSTVEELIPTAKFANVTVSNTVTRFVVDADVEAELGEAYDEADRALQPKRDKIIEELG